MTQEDELILISYVSTTLQNYKLILHFMLFCLNLLIQVVVSP